MNRARVGYENGDVQEGLSFSGLFFREVNSIAHADQRPQVRAHRRVSTQSRSPNPAVAVEISNGSRRLPLSGMRPR